MPSGEREKRGERDWRCQRWRGGGGVRRAGTVLFWPPGPADPQLSSPLILRQLSPARHKSHAWARHEAPAEWGTSGYGAGRSGSVVLPSASERRQALQNWTMDLLLDRWRAGAVPRCSRYMCAAPATCLAASEGAEMPTLSLENPCGPRGGLSATGNPSSGPHVRDAIFILRSF